VVFWTSNCCLDMSYAAVAMEEEKLQREEQQALTPPVPERGRQEEHAQVSQVTPVGPSDSPSSTPARAHSKAETVLKDATTLLQRLGVHARDAAIVAGQKLDQAALTVGAAVDNYALQVRVAVYAAVSTVASPRISLKLKEFHIALRSAHARDQTNAVLFARWKHRTSLRGKQ
jgi:hypothetical protein